MTGDPKGVCTVGGRQESRKRAHDEDDLVRRGSSVVQNGGVEEV